MVSETKYRTFNLINKEFALDVNVSKLPCGLNGPVNFSKMDEDGGFSPLHGQQGRCQVRDPLLQQCPQDIKFINGEANTPLLRAGGQGHSQSQHRL